MVGFACSPVNIETERLVLSMPPASAASEVVAYFTKNREHLRAWDPPRAPEFFSEEYWRQRLDESRAEHASDQTLRLMLMPKAERTVVGTCNFTSFERGPFCNCRLGYTLDADLEGQGYMTEALVAAIAYVFDELGLHRIEANYLPSNERSGRLLRRFGFAPLGYARDYLFIDGAWRDHVLTAVVNPKVPQPSR